MWFVLIKRRAVWGLENFLFSIGPCCANGVGVLQLKGSPFGEKVLTQNQLKRRGWILANRCFLCCDEEETINHILIHCPKARIL